MPIKGKKVPSLQGAVHQMSCCFAILDFRRPKSESRLCQIFTDDLEHFHLSRCDENVWSISTRDFIVERVCYSMLRIEVKGLPNDLFKASVTMMIMRFLPASRWGASRKATRQGFQIKAVLVFQVHRETHLQYLESAQWREINIETRKRHHSKRWLSCFHVWIFNC